jgi:hypothetical protein
VATSYSSGKPTNTISPMSWDFGNVFSTQSWTSGVSKIHRPVSFFLLLLISRCLSLHVPGYSQLRASVRLLSVHNIIDVSIKVRINYADILTITLSLGLCHQVFNVILDVLNIVFNVSCSIFDILDSIFDVFHASVHLLYIVFDILDMGANYLNICFDKF